MEDFSDPNLRLSSYDFARQMNIQRTMLMRAYLPGVGSARKHFDVPASYPVAWSLENIGSPKRTRRPVVFG
jgi:hypothetical protein